MAYDGANSERVLVVEDDETQARSLSRMLRALGATVYAAHTEREARDALAERWWEGVILDIGLPDGSGLDILREIRLENLSLPVLVCSAHLRPRILDEVHLLDAHFVTKPYQPRHFQKFLQRVRDNKEQRRQLFAVAMEDLVSRYRLTGAEMELLQCALRGHSRKEMAEARATSENTVKTQIRALLRKTEARNLSELCALVFAQTLQGNSGS